MEKRTAEVIKCIYKHIGKMGSWHFYRPDKDTDPSHIKFRYSAEILEKIGVNPALRQNLNNQNIGAVMSRLGFKKIHKKDGNGWAVIEKEGLEIATDSELGGDEIEQL